MARSSAWNSWIWRPTYSLPGIAQQVQLGLIRPQDDAVRADGMQSQRGVVQEIAEVLFAVAQFGEFPPGAPLAAVRDLHPSN